VQTPAEFEVLGPDLRRLVVVGTAILEFSAECHTRFPLDTAIKFSRLRTKRVSVDFAVRLTDD
jgi:hypothetical protein